MLNRRDFLITLTAISLAELISGCSQKEADLKIFLLLGSIPPQLIEQFKSKIGLPNILFQPEAQLKQLWTLLENWQNKNKEQKENQSSMPFSSSLVTLGDYWLADAIKQQLIEPLNIDELANWQTLSSSWHQLVKRNQLGQLDENGKIWGAPYRWGTTAIAYRADKFEALGWKPTDWRDLWREELRGQISLLDEPREVIGLTLKKLGYSYNTADLNNIPNLKSELFSLQEQVKFYSSDNYLKPLILGDTWLAVGWSSDIAPVAENYSQIEAIIPQSGTALWADLWVKPKADSPDINNVAKDWIDFCWQSRSASEISLFTDGVSPRILTMKPEEIPQYLFKNPLILLDPEIFKKSDFLYPLSKETEQEYLQLWQQMRAHIVNV